MNSPTAQLAAELTTAFNHFNERLFEGELPECVILLHRKQKAYGYFCPGSWDLATEPEVDPDDTDSEEDAMDPSEGLIHEIALNPDHLKGRPVKNILSTLAHEQVHLWQQVHGKPGINIGCWECHVPMVPVNQL